MPLYGLGTSIIQHFVSLTPYFPEVGYKSSPLVLLVMFVIPFGQAVKEQRKKTSIFICPLVQCAIHPSITNALSFSSNLFFQIVFLFYCVFSWKNLFFTACQRISNLSICMLTDLTLSYLVHSGFPHLITH